MARSPAMEQNPTLEIEDSAGLSLDSDSGDDPEDSEDGRRVNRLILFLALGLCLCIVCGVVIGILLTMKGRGPNSTHSSPESLTDCLGFEKCPAYPEPYSWGEWPKTYIYKGSFPAGFVWGVGTASYQIEGAYNEGGRGASIWDTFSGANTVNMQGGNCSYCCQNPPCPINPAVKSKGDTGNVATDSYHMIQTDLALMKAMGLKNYRFSIAWPRMFPLGESMGDPNPEAVKWYSDFINALLAANITPFVTLYHWDLPQALFSPPERSAWWARDAEGRPVGEILPNWKHYVDTCFRLFGDRVKFWITFNEAWSATKLASGSGKAPGVKPFLDPMKDPYIAGHNMLNAHAAAVDIYRRKYQYKQQGLIGITNNFDWREPKTDSQADIAAAERAVLFQLGWFSEPIFCIFYYSPEMRAVVGDILPKFTEDEQRLLKGSADFFGLNNYGTGWISAAKEPGWDYIYGTVSHDGFVHGQSAWLYGAGWGLRKLLNWVKRRYSGPVIYVTENGWSTAASTPEQAANDTDRVDYYANYTSEVRRAIEEDGVDVRGYFGWSLLDNYEWEMGYVERFGITFVDYNFGVDPNAPLPNGHVPTPGQQLRRRKKSSCFLEQLWRNNMLLAPNSPNLCVETIIFQGQYTFKNCTRVIDVYVGDATGSVTGKKPAGGGSCDTTTDLPYGPALLSFSGSTVICRTCKTGTGFMQGFWSDDDLGIQWDDGSLWVKAL